MSHLNSRRVDCGWAVNVHTLLRRRLWAAAALADASRNRHHRAASWTHGQARVLRKNKNTTAAYAGNAELLNRRDGRAHRAAHGRRTDRVGQGDVALLAGDLPGRLWSVRHRGRTKICPCA